MQARSRWRCARIVFSCAFLTGCTSAIPVSLPRAGPNTSCIAPAPEGDLLLGVALSGGGSRAAVFGAASLEALGRLRVPGGGSVLEHVGYLSSVSGGSVAASYYAGHKPNRETPVLTPEGSYTKEYEAFFRQFLERVTQNFESALIRRQIGSFRWFNSALAARSLEEVLKERLLGELSLGALSERQRRRDIPGLLFNAALFNSSRRFIFTTMPPDVARYDVFADLRRSAGRRGDTVEFVPLSQRMWEGLMPLTPLDLRVNPCAMPVASIVAASASFPPLVFVLNDDEAYGKGIANIFEATAKKIGLAIMANENIDWRQPDQKPVLTKIIASGADLVYMGGVIETGAQRIIRQMHEVGLVAPRVRLMGPDGLFVDELLTGTICDAAVATDMRVTVPGLPPEKLRGIGARTYEGYKNTFGKEPTPFALYAVEAGRVAIDGIRRAAAELDRAKDLRAKREAVRRRPHQVQVPARDGTVSFRLRHYRTRSTPDRR